MKEKYELKRRKEKESGATYDQVRYLRDLGADVRMRDRDMMNRFSSTEVSKGISKRKNGINVVVK